MPITITKDGSTESIQDGGTTGTVELQTHNADVTDTHGRTAGVLPLGQIPATLTGKDADTLDGDELTDIEATMDSKIATHKALPNDHHISAYKPSDSLLNNNTTERTITDNATYTKKKETRIHVSGHYRVTFELKRSGAIFTGYGKIYCNGVAVGTERSIASDSWTEQTAEDLHFNAGDLVQIYIKTGSGGGETTHVQNFKLKGTAMTAFEDGDP